MLLRLECLRFRDKLRKEFQFSPLHRRRAEVYPVPRFMVLSFLILVFLALLSVGILLEGMVHPQDAVDEQDLGPARHE